MMNIRVNIVAPLLALALVSTLDMQAEDQSSTIAWDASNPKELKWQIVNDTVMGGVSSSRFFLQNETGVFTGKLSLENNGGFASVRSVAQKLDFSSEFTRVMVRVRGDGRTYKMTARRNGSYGDVSYQKEFATVRGEWCEVELKLNDFAWSITG